MTIVAGVDLSGRGVGKTALAWLSGERNPPRLLGPPLDEGLRDRGPTDRAGDQRLVDLILEGNPEVVALDAPLELPHAVTCTDPDCDFCFPADGSTPSYGSRALEGDRWRAFMPGVRGPMPTVMVAGIAFRGIYLRRRLEGNVRVVETWPMGVYRALERAQKRRPALALDTAARRSLLASVVEGTDQVADSDGAGDQVDAVAAAYAAWSVAHGSAMALCSDRPTGEGAIWLPASFDCGATG